MYQIFAPMLDYLTNDEIIPIQIEYRRNVTQISLFVGHSMPETSREVQVKIKVRAPIPIAKTQVNP